MRPWIATSAVYKESSFKRARTVIARVGLASLGFETDPRTRPASRPCPDGSRETVSVAGATERCGRVVCD